MKRVMSCAALAACLFLSACGKPATYQLASTDKNYQLDVRCYGRMQAMVNSTPSTDGSFIIYVNYAKARRQMAFKEGANLNLPQEKVSQDLEHTLMLYEDPGLEIIHPKFDCDGDDRTRGIRNQVLTAAERQSESDYISLRTAIDARPEDAEKFRRNGLIGE